MPVPQMPNDELAKLFNRLCGYLVNSGPIARQQLAFFLRMLRRQKFRAAARNVISYAAWIGYPAKSLVGCPGCR